MTDDDLLISSIEEKSDYLLIEKGEEISHDNEDWRRKKFDDLWEIFHAFFFRLNIDYTTNLVQVHSSNSKAYQYMKEIHRTYLVQRVVLLILENIIW